MILVSQTYVICDEESADLGDFAEMGFRFEDKPVSFHELVALMRDHRNPSQWSNHGGIDVCLGTDFEMDFINGEELQTAIHYSRKNHPRYAKYWRKAMLAAGIEVTN